MSIQKHALQLAFDTLAGLMNQSDLWKQTKDEVLQIETAKPHLTGQEKCQEVRDILSVYAVNYGLPVGKAVLSFLLEMAVQYIRLAVI